MLGELVVVGAVSMLAFCLLTAASLAGANHGAAGVNARRMAMFVGPAVLCSSSLLLISKCVGLVGEQFILAGLITASPLVAQALSRGGARSAQICLLTTVCVGAGLTMLGATSLVGLVVAFELLTISALSLLRVTGKSDRAVSAFVEMYLGAVVGSSMLVVGTLLAITSCPSQVVGSSLMGQLSMGVVVAGFAVKVPLWPFASGLLRAHVEASTEFSILLSGLLVKFGVVGVLRVVELGPSAEHVSVAVAVLALVGLVDSCVKLFLQVDLKRAVAVLTVFETNGMTLCLLSGSPKLHGVGQCLVLVHGLTTASEFMLVEAIYRRFSSRSIVAVSGLSSVSEPLAKLAWLVVLVAIGVPGSSIFATKLLFAIDVASHDLLQCLLVGLVLLVAAPVALVRTGLGVIDGQSTPSAPTTSPSRYESLVIGGCAIGSVILGVALHCFLG